MRIITPVAILQLRLDMPIQNGLSESRTTGRHAPKKDAIKIPRCSHGRIPKDLVHRRPLKSRDNRTVRLNRLQPGTRPIRTWPRSNCNSSLSSGGEKLVSVCAPSIQITEIIQPAINMSGKLQKKFNNLVKYPYLLCDATKHQDDDACVSKLCCSASSDD